MANKQSPILCPQCNSDLFQKIPLGTISIGNLKNSDDNSRLTFHVSREIYICAKCGYELADIKDLTPQRITVHITGNSESFRRKAIIVAGFRQEDYQNWKDNYIILNGEYFVTKSVWENKQDTIPFPEHVILNVKMEC